MKKLCPVILGLFYFTSFQSQAIGKISIKPSISISQNTRSVNATFENAFFGTRYSETDLGATKLDLKISKFIQKPFGTSDDSSYGGSKSEYQLRGMTYLASDVDSTTDSDNDNSPDGYANTKRTHLENQVTGNWSLFKAGTNERADKNYAVDGSNLKFVSVTGTEKLEPVTFSEDNKKIDTSSPSVTVSGVSGSGTEHPKYQLSSGGDSRAQSVTSGDAYYVILNEPGDDDSNGVPNPTNASKLLQMGIADTGLQGEGNLGEVTESGNTRYYGLSIGVMADIQLSEGFHIALKSDLSAPVETVENQARHVTIKPELDASLRAGLLLGNANGSIGLLYGITHDRYTVDIKRVSNESDNPGTNIQSYEFTENYLSRDLVANVNISEDISAFFSAQLSENNTSLNINNGTADDTSTIPSPMNQRFSIGVSLNY